MAWYGGNAGPGSKFRVCIDMRTSSQNETSGYVQVRRWVQVVSGNFSGTLLKTSWAGSVRIYGSGTYADSGWQNVGWVGYGSSTTQSASANYTGYSGAYYSSSATGVYSPSVPTWSPKAPTNLTVARNSDSKCTLKWSNNSTTARRYASITVQRSTDGGAWANIRTGLAASTNSYADTTTAKNHYYRYRVLAVNAAGSAASSASAYIYNTPAACTNVVNTRNSDTKNTVTWQRGASTALYSSILVRRQVDGGAWADLATCANTATSYADTTTSPNHSYRYAVIPRNSAGSAPAAYSGTTYNTPAAPSRITVARKAETTIKATIVNPAKTASAMEVQRSTNGTSWTTIKTISGTVETFEDTPGGGTFYYRCRNTRGSLASAWKQADAAVVTITPPSAPTLLSPGSSTVVDVSMDSLTVRWSHNPIDGSAQTSAEVQFSTDGQSWDTHTVSGSAQTLTRDNDFPLNSLVRWRVRTKGAHADFSPWSATGTFHVYQVPTAVISAPGDGAVISATPVTVQISYSDPSGALSGISLSIARDGVTEYEIDMGTATSVTIDINSWLPEDGASYRITAVCRSTSTLQCIATRDVNVAFALPRPVLLGMRTYPEDGHVRISVYEGVDNALADIERVAIFRIVGEERVLLVEDALNELDFTDPYAPVNREFHYEAVSFANSGATNSRRFRGVLESPYTFFYYGDGLIAKAKLDPTEDISLTRPNAVENYYAGRRWPVSYDGANMGDERSFSGFLMHDEEALAFYSLMASGGRCVYKSVDGHVFHAKCTVDLHPEHTIPGVYGTVDVSIKRIDGQVL